MAGILSVECSEGHAQISDAEKLARAVLMFFSPDRWTDEHRDMWVILTGSRDATTKTLCDLARRVRAAEESRG